MLRNSKYVYGPLDNFIPAKLNVGHFLMTRFKKYGDNIALINAVNDDRLTYNDIVQTAMNLAVSLSRIGVKKGDFVGVCTETRLENWSLIMGVTCIGAVVTPFNIGYIKDELRHVMNISKPKYLFCTTQSYTAHKEVFQSLEYLEKIIFIDGDELGDEMIYKNLATPSRNSLINKNVNWEEFKVNVEGGSETACIMYSSGTTGLPKGVMLSHLNMIASCCMPNLCDPKLTVLNIAPWYHAMGLMTNLCYMCNGTTTAFFSKFDMNTYLQSIEKYKINQLILVPTVLLAILKTPCKYDVSSVEVILSGATVLHKETVEAGKAKFKNLRGVFQGYGMTEATVLVSLNSHVDGKVCKPGSVGTVVSNTVLKIVDIETRQPLGPYQRGEICFKSPSLMKGYYGMDNFNDYDEDGFFKTGDIGYYDHEKYLYVVDRLKELIKYKGNQVPPAEIESVLLQHPGVCEAGVTGMPHPIAGEVPIAFVVKQPGVTITESELQQFVAKRLSNPKHLRGGVRFLNEIPKNLNGKILRNVLRKMAEKIEI